MRLATTLTLVTIATGTAWGGAALDADPKPAPTTPTPDAAVSPDAPVTPDPDRVSYGVDLRIRDVFLPAGLIGLFVQRVPGSTSTTGIGLDLIRRRGNLEISLGFEYEHIAPAEGVWIQNGDTVPTDTVDYILSAQNAPESFGWFTIEFTFMNNTPINKYVAFRYGGGAGLGILTGGLYRWDTQCSNSASNTNVDPGCIPSQVRAGGQGTTLTDNGGAPETSPAKYNLPPVFPVINAIVGFQFKPFDKAVINVEGGIRTLPFIGMSFGYFFN